MLIFCWDNYSFSQPIKSDLRLLLTLLFHVCVPQMLMPTKLSIFLLFFCICSFFSFLFNSSLLIFLVCFISFSLSHSITHSLKPLNLSCACSTSVSFFVYIFIYLKYCCSFSNNANENQILCCSLVFYILCIYDSSFFLFLSFSDFFILRLLNLYISALFHLSLSLSFSFFPSLPHSFVNSLTHTHLPLTYYLYCPFSFLLFSIVYPLSVLVKLLYCTSYSSSSIFMPHNNPAISIVQCRLTSKESHLPK